MSPDAAPYKKEDSFLKKTCYNQYVRGPPYGPDERSIPMKKAICIILAFMLAATAFAACGREKAPGGDAPDSTQTEAPAEENAVEVAGERLKLTYETNHKDLHYKTDIVNLTPNTVNAVSNLVYYKDGEPLIVMHLVYFEGKTPEEVMAGSDNVLSDKTVNGLDYKYFEYDENGVPGHTYVAEFGGTTYTISFASAADISALETAFMENVRFAAE